MNRRLRTFLLYALALLLPAQGMTASPEMAMHCQDMGAAPASYEQPDPDHAHHQAPQTQRGDSAAVPCEDCTQCQTCNWAAAITTLNITPAAPARADLMASITHVTPLPLETPLRPPIAAIV